MKQKKNLKNYKNLIFNIFMPDNKELEETQFQLPKVDGYFTGPIPEGLKPQLYFVGNLYNYLEKNPNFSLGEREKDTFLREFTIANFLSQYLYLENMPNRPVLNEDTLRSDGLDPARIARWLIFQTTYPKGIDINNEILSFNTSCNSQKDESLTDELTQILKENLPKTYGNIQQQDFLQILESVGFRYNRESKSYICNANQEQLRQLISGIINTRSSLPS